MQVMIVNTECFKNSLVKELGCCSLIEALLLAQMSDWTKGTSKQVESLDLLVSPTR